jgi:hypothetical protein
MRLGCGNIGAKPETFLAISQPAEILTIYRKAPPPGKEITAIGFQ